MVQRKWQAGFLSHYCLGLRITGRLFSELGVERVEREGILQGVGEETSGPERKTPMISSNSAFHRPSWSLSGPPWGSGKTDTGNCGRSRNCPEVGPPCRLLPPPSLPQRDRKWGFGCGTGRGRELVWNQLCMSLWEQVFLSPCTCCQLTPQSGGTQASF